MYVETSWRYFLPSQRNGLTQFLTQHVRRVNLSFEAKTRRFHNYVEVIFGVLRRRQNTSPFIGAAACEQKTKTHPNTRILNGENAPLRYHVSNTETVKRGLPIKKKINIQKRTWLLELRDRLEGIWWGPSQSRPNITRHHFVLGLGS